MKLEFIHKNETWNVGGFKKCECGSTKFSFSKGYQKARCDSCGLVYDVHKANDRNYAENKESAEMYYNKSGVWTGGGNG